MLKYFDQILFQRSNCQANIKNKYIIYTLMIIYIFISI